MNSNGIITAPVSIDDVKTVLGITSNDLAVLCSSPKINMWAKYKPVPLNKNFHSDEWDQTNKKWRSDSIWWKGSDGHCGITITAVKAATYTAVAALYNGSDNGWKYSHPSGGNSAPYRLDDFIGYVHTAIASVSDFSGTKTGYTDTIVEFSIAYTIGGSDTSLALSDISDGTPFADMYFGIYIHGAKADIRLTSSATLANGGTSVSVPGYKLVDGTYTVYPFLCSEMIGISDADMAADFYTLPNCNAQSLKILEASITVDAAAMSYSATAGTAEYRVEVKNLTGNSVSLTSLIVEARVNEDDSAPLSGDESRIIIVSTSVTIPARTTETYTGSINVPLDSYTPRNIYIHAKAVVSNKNYSSGYASLA
jgi:hypothetical protein